MIRSFEVGAVFKIINQASPALAQILKQVRELNIAIDKARANLGSISSSATAGLAGAVGETQALAGAWREVAAASALATRNLTSATAAGRSAAAAGAVGGGGGRHRPGWLGGGGIHFRGPGAPIPGGGHMRLGGGAMVGAGLLGYAGYEAAEMEKAVWQMIYHTGESQKDPAVQKKFTHALQEAMIASGYNVTDVSEAALQAVRMFQGTPG